jgi:superoxide dismutase, Fe-Mn family
MKYLNKSIKSIKLKILESKFNEQANLLLTEMKKIGIEKLPYSYSAFREFIDPKTMDIHYNKHYKGYVDKLNQALSKKDYGDVELENIIKNISKYNKAIRNNAGGAFNHALFWNMLTPKPKKISEVLLDKITKQFGSFSNFKKKFEIAAKSRFGSGWVWLVVTKRKTLKIMTTPNQDNPLMDIIKFGGFPILGLDLWEHSYYLKYQNKRDEYVKNFWKVVNWDFVTKLYELKVKTNLIESANFKKKDTSVSKSFCPPTQFNASSRIINDGKLGKIYKDGVVSILKKIFGDFWRSETQNTMAGFYYLEKDGRSMINNISTNKFAFCILVNAVNNRLDLMKRYDKKFDFTLAMNRNQIELSRFISALNYFKDQIFAKDNPDFVALLEKLKENYEKGELSENKTINKIKNFFGDRVSVENVSGHGNKIDAIKGIDVIITLDGEIYTAQIKPYSDMSEKDGIIKIMTNSLIKAYQVDWMIFINDKTEKVLIFKNKPKIKDSKYEFDSNLLLYEID